MFQRRGLPSSLLMIAVFLSGCASARYLVRSAPTNAEEAYQQAMEDMEAGLYPEAIRGFAELKTKYPYTKYAALADLRSADTQFHRAKWAESVDAYRNFLKFHPNHEEAPYAMLQIGEAYFEQIPDDWFFLPPAAEKDQGNTKLAISAFKDLIGRFTTSESAEKGRGRLKECRRKLADHELYVANFYFSRERFRAAAGRAEKILASYEGLGLEQEALWIAGKSRFQIGEVESALDHLNELQEKFPNNSWASDASGLLAKIGEKAKPEPDKPEGG